MSRKERRISGRDKHLWLQLWHDKAQSGFHQPEVNVLLTRFWSTLNLPSGSRVFVPLCGKSLDMIWLADQGHEVIGVELSRIAVEAFFRENRLTPVTSRCGEFTRWQHGRITILCGDYFALNRAMLGNVATVYDRAALTALPEETRRLYVKKLRKIVSRRVGIFLLTVEDVDSGDVEEAAPEVDRELTALYATAFDIRLAYEERLMESDLQRLGEPSQQVRYKVYRLTGRARSR